MKVLFWLIPFLFLWLPVAEGASGDQTGQPAAGFIPILLYHRFGPTVADSMTVTTPVFEGHLKYLADHGYQVIPLRALIESYLKREIPRDSRLVAITADDGHKSLYTEALPLLRKYKFSMTVFLYPSAISNASYAMTWNQIREMKETGLFDFQSHSYWHPNFKKERERLPPAEFDKFVEMQLRKSKEVLKRELKAEVDMLAWPFGIHDGWLMNKAAEMGYVAAFTMDRHPATPGDPRLALPRYLVADTDKGKAFARILTGK